MERGEIAAFGVSFLLLAALAFFLSLSAPGNSGPPQGSNLDVAFWGAPSLDQRISYGGTLSTHSNQSLVYVRFSLNLGATVSGASASRVCRDQLGNAGDVRNYANLTYATGSGANEYFLIIGPAAQTQGWHCTYTAMISLSTNVVLKWTGTVEVQ